MLWCSHGTSNDLRGKAPRTRTCSTVAPCGNAGCWQHFTGTNSAGFLAQQLKGQIHQGGKTKEEVSPMLGVECLVIPTIVYFVALS